MLPAAGQGIVAIEVLSSSQQVIDALNPLNDFRAFSAALAERALVADLEGSCTSPIGGFAEVEDQGMRIRGFVGDLKGIRTLRAEVSGRVEESEDLGRKLAEKLNRQGAREILKSCEPS
jgi:hydroxymethylbilane synthase